MNSQIPPSALGRLSRSGSLLQTSPRSEDSEEMMEEMEEEEEELE
jgi:hypothetical protein